MTPIYLPPLKKIHIKYFVFTNCLANVIVHAFIGGLGVATWAIGC